MYDAKFIETKEMFQIDATSKNESIILMRDIYGMEENKDYEIICYNPNEILGVDIY